MAQVAYDLERFARQSRGSAPRVRVAKRVRSERQKQIFRMARMLVGALVLVFMVCSVLYTNARITEVQSDIAGAQKALTEQEALNHYYTFELDNQTSLSGLEGRAEAQGLERADSARTQYFRVEENGGIEVKQNTFMQLWNNAKDGLLNILDYITP